MNTAQDLLTKFHRNSIILAVILVAVIVTLITITGLT